MVNPKLQTLAHIKNYKDQWRLEDSLQHPQNREFVQHPLCSSRARSKRATTCWTTSLRSRCLWINSLLLGGIYKRRRHYFKTLLENVGIKQVLDHRLGDDADEGVDDGVHDNIFDTWNGEVQGTGAPRWRCSDGVASKQSPGRALAKIY